MTLETFLEALANTPRDWRLSRKNQIRRKQFVGDAVNHCGPFYLWGSGVPPMFPQGIGKGMTRKAMGHREYKGQPGWNTKNERAPRRLDANGCASIAATIPPELAACVVDYAERLCEASVR